MATLRQLADYYVARLIVQFRTQPKAQNTIAILVKQALLDNLAAQLLAAFNIETAIGKQLDTLGKYIGVPRNIGALVAAGYFGFWNYGSALDLAKYQGTWDPATDAPAIPAASGGNTGNWYVASATGTSTTPIAADFIVGDIIVSDGTTWARQTTDNGNGLTSYTDFTQNPNGLFYSYSTAARSVTDLTDESYRTVLMLQIILNSNDGTLASIMDLLQLFFPQSVTLVDNADMSLDYYVYSTVPLTKAILESYLPRPMGVGITVTIVSPPVPGTDGALLTEDGFTLTTEDGTTLTIEPT